MSGMHAVSTPTVPLQLDAEVRDFGNFIMSSFTYFRKIYPTGSISVVTRMNDDDDDDKPPCSKYITHNYSLILFSAKLL
jgi:hypothetical protein